MNGIITTVARTAKIASGLGITTIVNSGVKLALKEAELGAFREMCTGVATFGMAAAIDGIVCKTFDEMAVKADEFYSDIKSRVEKKEKETIKVETIVEKKEEKTEEVKEEKPKKTSKKKNTKKKEEKVEEEPKEETE